MQRIADGTIIGDELVTGTCVGFHFLRNLVLKALGADVALTAVITTRVVAFDLVSVGHLATVHGKQLTAVHFGERRMILKSISVGNGAFVDDSSFETSIRDSISSSCEIHTFDMNPWRHYTAQTMPNFMNFHVLKVGMKPPAKSIPQLVKDLKHSGRTNH